MPYIPSSHTWKPSLMALVFFCRLKWDEKEFGNVSVLRVYPGDLWLPDLELFNSKVTWVIFFVSKINSSLAI